MYLFYYLPAADPAVISYDASTLATTMSSGQFMDLLTMDANPLLDGVADVTGPVFVQLGEFDMIAPAVNAALEPGYWASADSVDVDVVEGIGHDSNLHLNHQESWEGIAGWLDDTLDLHCSD